METSSKYFLRMTFCFFLLTDSSYAADFLSIACGAAAGRTDTRNIEWVTDDGFIQTGKNLRGLDAGFPYDSLKYFPEGRSKNCFVLPAKNATTYLLRISFYPGNATTAPSIDSPVDFNVTVNNDLWLTYAATADIRPSGWAEAVFHTFAKGEIYLCLVKGTKGFPFINGIELREQNTSSYSLVKKGKFLITSDRYNTGTKPDNGTLLRYPDDPYDRIWFPTPTSEFPAYPRVENMSVTSSPATLTAEDGYNWPPTKVLEDAWVGRNLSSPNFQRPDGLTLLYVAFYIKEIRPVNVSEADPIGMTLGLNSFSFDVNITNVNDLTVSITRNISDALTVNLTVISKPWSKQSAILNGFEMYSVQDVDTSETFPRDQDPLTAVQRSFGLEDWTGDPCYPVAWDWVACDSTSRISKLLLSKSNISGTIPVEISQLKNLTEIHLDNNKLTGEIPPSLLSLTKLKILKLDNNSLSGPIPADFQDYPGFTFSGNPGLCLTGNGSCASPPGARPPSSDASTAVKLVSNKLSITVAVVLAVPILDYLMRN
ncbi:hypothetical protein R1sor_018856 [Riccia sorocarpa]|uniref:Malectin-like domain-containing protein n=1 Tax=Riccia sorocarpa TaxID=122646 RepID=A0ABD3IH55_9MARC